MSENAKDACTLPDKWEYVPLGKCVLKVEKVKPSDRPKEEIRYIDIASIDNDLNILVDFKTYKGEDAPSRARQKIQTNDILFSTVRTYLRNIAQVPKEHDGDIASTGFCVIRPYSDCHPRYFFYLSLWNGFLNPLSKIQRGTSYPAVRDSDVFEQCIPLPPSNEQRRIVSKIEELFSELDNSVASLKKAKEQLKVYRQAVLKHAFEGKLTAKWREENKDKLESADALLERIKKERAERYEQQVNEWKQAVKAWEDNGKEGKKPTKPRKPPTSNLGLPEDIDLPALPASWKWVPVESTSEIIGGYAFKSKDFVEDGTWQVVKIANVRMGYLRLNEATSFITDVPAEIIEKYRICQGDCLISLTGTRRKRDYGFVAHVDEDQPLLLNQRVASVRAHQSLCSKYFELALQCPHYQDYFFHQETGNVGQGNVGMRSVAEGPIPLPSVEEQKFIVAEVERLFSVADNVEKTLDTALRSGEVLKQSILKKAFEGQLVKQDPNDEPASKLLERIRAEMPSKNGTGKVKTRSKRKIA